MCRGLYSNGRRTRERLWPPLSCCEDDVLLPPGFEEVGELEAARVAQPLPGVFLDIAYFAGEAAGLGERLIGQREKRDQVAKFVFEGALLIEYILF